MCTQLTTVSYLKIFDTAFAILCTEPKMVPD